MTACRICGKGQPGPLPSDAIARINAADWRPLVVRVLRGLSLHVAPIDDFLCRPCHNRFSREPIVVPFRVTA